MAEVALAKLIFSDSDVGVCILLGIVIVVIVSSVFIVWWYVLLGSNGLQYSSS